MTDITQAVYEFIKEKCPSLREYHSVYQGVGVDFLAEDAMAYMIESTEVDPILKRYINGDCEKQFVFTFASREFYGDDARQNLKNIRFYHEFAEWLDECTRKKDLPVIDGRRRALKIETTSTVYVFDTEASKARYQIPCRLVYYEKGE